MNHSEKKKKLQIIFISYEQNEDAAYLVNLLKRHPEICVFDGTDQLVDNLLKFPNSSFGIHNTIFFELLFELFNDKRFFSSENGTGEMEKVSQSKTCYDAFFKLMELYCDKTKPSATMVAYRFPEPSTFKMLFRNYIIKDLRAKYIHQLTDEFQNGRAVKEDSSDSMLSAICNGIIQVRIKNFVLNYEYEYRRLFRFLNTSFGEIPEREKKNKKLYKKPEKLSEVQNSWFRQIVSVNENKLEEVLIGNSFRD